EFKNVLTNLGPRTQLLHASDGPTKSRVRFLSTGPVNASFGPFAFSFDRDDDLVNELPENVLPIRISRGRRVPQHGQIFGQAANLFLLLDTQQARLSLHKAFMFFLHSPFGSEFFLPGCFERSGNQAILRLDSLILTLGPFRLVTSAFQ